MARRNPKVGTMTCPTCGGGVFVREAASGKLHFDCEACDCSGYAEKGGKAARRWRAGMTPIEDDEGAPVGAPAPAADPKPAPAPAARRPVSAFNLGAL